MSAREASAWAPDVLDAVDLGEVADCEPPNHPLLVKVTRWLSQIVLGDEAARMLTYLDEQDDDHTAGQSLRLGQLWLWREPKISVGRKGRALDGASYALPIRVTWDGGHLQLSPPGPPLPGPPESGQPLSGLWGARPAFWSATGMGWDLNGTASAIAPTSEIPAAGFSWPATGAATVEVTGDVRATLSQLVDAGTVARWEFLLWLQPTVSSALVRAHSSIRAEMGNSAAGILGAPLVDQVKLDQLRDQMLFGDDLHSSAAERLLTMCTAPGTFCRVDPLRYLTTAIRRDAMTTLRRAIGDPHVGPKVRSLARELGTTDVDTIVAEYRRRWPGDHLAADRATQALSVGSDAMAHWVQVVER